MNSEEYEYMKKIYKKPFVQIKTSDEHSGNETDPILKASDGMLIREIAGETLLVPVGEMALKIHGMISLSESGALLWKKLKGGCTEAELVDAVLGEYEVEREIAISDVKEFVDQMRKVGILVEADRETL